MFIMVEMFLMFGNLIIPEVCCVCNHHANFSLCLLALLVSDRSP